MKEGFEAKGDTCGMPFFALQCQASMLHADAQPVWQTTQCYQCMSQPAITLKMQHLHCALHARCGGKQLCSSHALVKPIVTSRLRGHVITTPQIVPLHEPCPEACDPLQAFTKTIHCMQASGYTADVV